MTFETISNSTIDEQMLFGFHKSGLPIYVFPKKGFSKYYAVYATKYGSIDSDFMSDDEVINVPDGIAHFLEHKLFEEKDGGNALDRFAETGANANAFTSFNITAYLFSCTDDFYKNLEILLKFVNEPHFTDENVSREQGIIGQEIKMYADDPNWRVYFNLLSSLYHNHPVKKDIAGTVESIGKITPEILYKCYDTFYHPSNMILFIVGDVDEHICAELADKHVQSRIINKMSRIYPDEPKTIVRSSFKESLSVAVPIFDIAFKDTDVGYDKADLYRKSVISEIALNAFIGGSSTLYNNLYEEGLIDDSFELDITFEKDYGFSGVSGESNDPHAVFDRIIKYINKIKNDGFIKDDIERARKVLLGRYVGKFNSIEAIGNSCMRNLFNGIDIFNATNVFKSITYDEVYERFLSHITPDCATISIVEPF